MYVIAIIISLQFNAIKTIQRKRIPASVHKTGTPFFHDVIDTKIKTLF